MSHDGDDGWKAARKVVIRPTDTSRHDEPTTPADAPAPRVVWKLLVVDDNIDAAEVLVEALTADGHETVVAHDAPSALEIAAAALPNGAFLDIGLPGMDGYELAERIRLIPGLERIRLIALTGYGHEEDRRRTREAGFDHHLVKPVDFTAVSAVLQSLDANPSSFAGDE